MANNMSTNITYNVSMETYLLLLINRSSSLERLFFVYTTCSSIGFAERTSGICPISKPVRVFKINFVMTSACQDEFRHGGRKKSQICMCCEFCCKLSTDFTLCNAKCVNLQQNHSKGHAAELKICIMQKICYL